MFLTSSLRVAELLQLSVLRLRRLEQKPTSERRGEVRVHPAEQEAHQWYN